MLCQPHYRFVGTSVPAAADWKPTRDIEFVVPSSAGGGSDLNARTISDLARKNSFSPRPLMVVNKPGGSGAVAFSYVNTKKGRCPHPDGSPLWTGCWCLCQRWRVGTEDLTYIGTVAFDELTLGVRKDSPYQDVPSLIAAAKENPGKITIGGSQRGNSDHLSFELINKYTEGEFSYVVFNSSGEVMSAVLGDTLMSVSSTPQSASGRCRAGEDRSYLPPLQPTD